MRRARPLALAALPLLAGCNGALSIALTPIGALEVGLHNGAPHPVVVGISAPLERLDCDVLKASPALLSPVLAAVEWSEPQQIVLRPNQLTDPLRLPEDDAVHVNHRCAVRRIEVEGVGARWIVVDRESPPGRGFPPHATLSELGEGAVTILPRASDPFRATSADLLYTPTDPFAVCPIEERGPPMLIALDGLPGRYDTVVDSVTTTVQADQTCAEIHVAPLVAEGDVPSAMSAEICADGLFPGMPFEAGDAVEFRWRTHETGDSLQLTSEIASWAATNTLALSPQAIRFEAPSWAEPTCIDTTEASCTKAMVDRLTLSMQRRDNWRETLTPVYPGTTAVFEVPTNNVGTTADVEHVGIWVDEVRSRVSTEPECGPQAVEMVFTRSLIAPGP